MTGAIGVQLSLLPDTGAIPAGSCPALADNCNENAATSDRGTVPQLKITDLAGNLIRLDGVNPVLSEGTPIRVTAAASTLTGGCASGAAQYRFTRNGALAQDWSAKAYFQDSLSYFASYTVQVRCSSDFSCTSLVGEATGIDDIDLNMLQNGSATWRSEPQSAPFAGYDVFRGAQVDDGNAATANPPNNMGTGFATLACNVPQSLPTGTLISVATGTPPAANTAQYFLVGHNNTTGGAMTVLGFRSNGTVRISPLSCP